MSLNFSYIILGKIPFSEILSIPGMMQSGKYFQGVGSMEKPYCHLFLLAMHFLWPCLSVVPTNYYYHIILCAQCVHYSMWGMRYTDWGRVLWHDFFILFQGLYGAFFIWCNVKWTKIRRKYWSKFPYPLIEVCVCVCVCGWVHDIILQHLHVINH